MASLRCHGDSDCNKTQIIRNFHLYIIQLWKPFFHIFTHGDVVNTQTWEVSPPKKSSLATLIQSYLERREKQKGVECLKRKLIEKSLAEVPLTKKMPRLTASLPKQAGEKRKKSNVRNNNLTAVVMELTMKGVIYGCFT